MGGGQSSTSLSSTIWSCYTSPLRCQPGELRHQRGIAKDEPTSPGRESAPHNLRSSHQTPRSGVGKLELEPLDVWRLTFDPQMLSAKRRRTLGLGPLEDAIEDLAPAEMLAAKKSDEASPLHDVSGTVAKPREAVSIKSRLQRGQALFPYWL